jgi:hypothetical protein
LLALKQDQTALQQLALKQEQTALQQLALQQDQTALQQVACITLCAEECHLHGQETIEGKHN